MDEKLEQDVHKLKDDMASLRTDLAIIKSNYATKEDLYRAINEQTLKFVTLMGVICTALVAAAFFLARNVTP